MFQIVHLTLTSSFPTFVFALLHVYISWLIMSHLLLSSFMCSVNCPSVDIAIPRYLHRSGLCSLLLLLFISSSSFPVLTIIYFVFFRPNLSSFPFPSLHSYSCKRFMCSALPAVAMSSINTGILIFYLTISIFYFFSSAVNCGCFCTAHDGSKYCALFYHSFDLYIICVSYWCSNFFFFNWDSLHARLNSHYETWSYKKKKSTKKITDYRKSV